MRPITILLFGVLLAMGCQRHESAKLAGVSGMNIQNVTWQLSEIGGKPAEPVAADDRAPHFRLDPAEKRATGYSSVNQFSGGYELQGKSLKFGMLAMTRRAGPEPLMKQEYAFTRALEQTRSWRAAGDSIELLDSAGNVLARFSPSPATK